MKKVLITILCMILSISLVFAAASTSSPNLGSTQEKAVSNQVQTQNIGENSQIQTQERERAYNVVQEQNRLRIGKINQSECPQNCTCSGSGIKCGLGNEREMTIHAGNSGNTIVQVKKENMSTNVTLYKSEDKVYGIMKDGEIKKVNMLPDQVKEKIERNIQQRGENYEMVLDEKGMYQVQTEKKSRLFLLFPVKEKVRAEINSSNGEVIKVRNPWWGFLAKDNKEMIVGSSCGTVTPGYNDECCQNKGYDYWNNDTGECEFTL